MPVVKKSAAAVAKSPAKSSSFAEAVEKELSVPDLPEREVYSPAPAPVFKRVPVSFVENVLTVDLTALEALPQGKRQAAVKTARAFLDRASQ